ncbi:MAG: hypothetical protein DRN15_05395 [Thermoprotei archaeon]|nr:MAG: hypothetical protein DRM97_08255 [Thermoprotei archaeon]RLF23748.1 MAG: hypothetical protein DRN15_05395 [Thermoprotei archaeon]
MRLEVLIGGRGGQGVQLMAKVLGHALAIYEGKEVVHVGTYGAETRGGVSIAELIVGDCRDEVMCFKVSSADIAILLHSIALGHVVQRLKEGALVFIDPTLVSAYSLMNMKAKVIEVSSHVSRRHGLSSYLNIFMLGVMAGATGLLKLDSLVRSVEDVIKRNREINLEAARRGYQYGIKLSRGSRG